MKNPDLSHVGLIVADLDKGVDFFQRLLDGPPLWIKDLPAVGLRLAEFRLGNTSIELLEVSKDGGGLGGKVMGRQPGLNHLALTVADLDSSLEEFRAKGLKVMDGFPRQGAHGRVAFFEPETTMDILLEICQPEPED